MSWWALALVVGSLVAIASALAGIDNKLHRIAQQLEIANRLEHQNQRPDPDDS